ncbi:MAG: hypothetical protein JWQ21_849 [Herminiimonas sp.]|nr:hypothetical protein [Herminiimonas sp.]
MNVRIDPAPSSQPDLCDAGASFSGCVCTISAAAHSSNADSMATAASNERTKLSDGSSMTETGRDVAAIRVVFFLEAVCIMFLKLRGV